MGGMSGEWAEALKEEFEKPYYRKLDETLHAEYLLGEVYPPSADIFTAFQLTPLSKTRVVILGQDPYHEPGEAHGLAFSVRKGTKLPPSLRNIYEELHRDTGCEIPDHGDLSHWADEGVLLLNAILTVRAHRAFSHKGIGWEEFTDAAIRAIDREDRPIAFILWGKAAQAKKALITNPNRLILESVHPSPLSAYRGFFGSRPFSRVNEYFASHGEKPIDWEIR